MKFSGHPTHTTIGERRTYECRICGKVTQIPKDDDDKDFVHEEKMITMSQVLRTYEGRRLHEKLQHVAKLNMELAAAPQMDAEEGR